MLEPQDSEYLWIVIVGFILAFVLAFGIGANDVANSFGTSVGSKVLTLKQACFIASIFEVAGAVLIGARVSDTVRKGIIDINSFNGTEEYAMVGSLSALTGTSVWLLVATFFNLPVSGTHSVVGATMGFALVAQGLHGVQWKTFGKIAGSWVVSPLLSGLISSLLFMLVRRIILRKPEPFEAGLKFLPLFYAFTITVNFFSVFYKGSHMLHFNKIPLYGVLILTFGSGIVTALFVRFYLVGFMRRRIIREVDQLGIDVKAMYTPDVDPAELLQRVEVVIEEKEDEMDVAEKSLGQETNGETSKLCNELSTPSSDINRSMGMKGMTTARCLITDEPKTGRLFAFLQILTASFGAFAHGGNDVSNCIGPLISLWTIYWTGEIAQKVAIPVWILLYGGVGISIGLWVWGRRVIKTVGEDLTPITPSSGFTIEIGSALTVLLASNLGIPISTTHCKVGSVVMVGRARSREVVDWKVFRNVVLAWVVTMPVAGAISGASYAALREIL
ncbi:sodium-dependent phosphate transporter 1 [Nematostella vectensis]|uniref:sodium-dependent phosphate transporter 1 n=1 Tax=Nematostella vectensis TaxID=45351 RepID=UPI002076D958|nr:sodium-dependent phosphate transporter 1 [Nematostella vectensis]